MECRYRVLVLGVLVEGAHVIDGHVARVQKSEQVHEVVRVRGDVKRAIGGEEGSVLGYVSYDRGEDLGSGGGGVGLDGGCEAPGIY